MDRGASGDRDFGRAARPTRAVLFDLDDTLYDERRFALSGFAALARVVAGESGIPAGTVFRWLAGSVRAGHRADALQRLCARVGCAESAIPAWVEVIRRHSPRLRLPSASARAIGRLRAGWATALVTNGLPSVQARKVEALGIGRAFDAIVFAERYGSGLGKPERAPFDEALARLGVPPSRAVMVGNDPVCDIGGGRAAGLWTVRLRGRARLPTPSGLEEADLVVHRIDEIPGAVERLVGPTPGLPRALASVPGLA